MVAQFLDQLNQYSNLILVAVTTAYVILTWGMVREMRRARELESEPQVIATLIPFPVMNVKLRIQNVGRGPALNLTATFWFGPENKTSKTSWLQPVLLSNSFEDFILPGHEFSLEKLASQHDKLIIELQWRNIFKHSSNANYEIDLKQQLEGWSKVGFLVKPDETPIQLGKIKDELEKIRRHFDKIENDAIQSDLLDQYRKEKNPLWQLWNIVNQLIQKIIKR